MLNQLLCWNKYSFLRIKISICSWLCCVSSCVLWLLILMCGPNNVVNRSMSWYTESSLLLSRINTYNTLAPLAITIATNHGTHVSCIIRCSRRPRTIKQWQTRHLQKWMCRKPAFKCETSPQANFSYLSESLEHKTQYCTPGCTCTFSISPDFNRCWWAAVNDCNELSITVGKQGQRGWGRQGKQEDAHGVTARKKMKTPYEPNRDKWHQTEYQYLLQSRLHLLLLWLKWLLWCSFLWVNSEQLLYWLI